MKFMDVMRDERGFVHKRLLGAAKGFLSRGPIGAIGGFVGPTKVTPRFPSFPGFPGFPGSGAPTPFTQLGADCPPGTRPASGGRCVNVTTQWLRDTVAGRIFAAALGTNVPLGIEESIPGLGKCDPPNTWVGDICVAPGTPAGPPGEASMGRYGAALEPTFVTINTRNCLRGMVLANDGLCYNKSQVKNTDRMWPAGRKPLLTGGDLNAIRKAAAAGRKLTTATKRLQRIGLMKKPGKVSRRALPAQPKVLKLIESGPGSVQL